MSYKQMLLSYQCLRFYCVANQVALTLDFRSISQICTF